jgi:tape measure domain-containing protein
MAATDLEKLVVQLSADITKYEKSLNKALSQTNSNASKMEKRFKSMTTSINSSLNGIGGKGFALGSGFLAGVISVDKIAQYSDAFTTIQNSLKIAGLQGEELNSVFEKLTAQALKNHAPVDDLAKLYGKAAMQQKNLGASSEDLLKFTDAVAASLRVSGTSAQDASGPLLQLAQSLGTGRVMAEEFNSVLEGMPALAGAIANNIKQANGSIGTLKQLVSSGDISSRALFDAAIQGAQELNDKANLAGTTISQAMTDLRTNLIVAVGGFNDATHASDFLVKAIQDLGNDLKGAITDVENLVVSLQGLAPGPAIQELITGINGVGLAARDAYALVRQLAGGVAAEVKDNLMPDQAARDRESAILSVYTPDQAAKDKASVQDTLNAIDKMAADNAEKFDALPANGPQPTSRPKPTPIDLDDPKYAVPGQKDKAGSGKAKKEKLDAYQKETQSIKDRTNVLNAETAAQAQVNPLVDDYGYALAKAKAQQDLINAATKAHKPITDEMRAAIDLTAEAYAQASVEAEKLAEKQKKVKETQQEISDTAKDVTRGIVDGFIAGKSAADIFSDALTKIANKLLDSAFDSLFDSKSSGGAGLGGAISKLFGFADGGYTGPGGKYDAAGIVHKGEYVIPADKVRKMGVGGIERMLDGFADGGPVQAPRISKVSPGASSGNGLSINYSPTYDNRGIDSDRLARLEQIQEKDRSEFASRTVDTIRKARNNNVKGI